MQLRALALPFAALVVAATGARAAEVGHFNGGFMNIRDYIVPADPGLYGVNYNYFYSSDRLNDKNGDEERNFLIHTPGPILPDIPVQVDVDVDLYALGLGMIWVSDWDVLGAKYAAYIVPTFANANVSAGLSTARRSGRDVSNSSFALGDMFVQPVWLGWKSDHLDVSAGYGFYAPTGKYGTRTIALPNGAVVRVDDPNNIGYGFWTHQFQAAASIYPFDNKGTAIVGAVTYEYHWKKEDFDLQPGQDVTINWGISQYVPLTSNQQLLLEIGPAGYQSWQVSADDGSDATNNDRDRVLAAGGQLGLTYVPWGAVVNFHGFYEYETRDRFQGYSLGLNLAKKF